MPTLAYRLCAPSIPFIHRHSRDSGNPGLPACAHIQDGEGLWIPEKTGMTSLIGPSAIALRNSAQREPMAMEMQKAIVRICLRSTKRERRTVPSASVSGTRIEILTIRDHPRLHRLHRLRRPGHVRWLQSGRCGGARWTAARHLHFGPFLGKPRSMPRSRPSRAPSRG